MGRATSSNCSRSTAIHRRHEPVELEAVGAPQALKVKGRSMEGYERVLVSGAAVARVEPKNTSFTFLYRAFTIGSLRDSTELSRFGALVPTTAPWLAQSSQSPSNAAATPRS